MQPTLRNTFALALLAIAGSALAVKPQQWVHQTEADFSAAERESVIATNLGEVELARGSKQLAELEGEDSILYDLARLGDGRVFAAVGPIGKIVQLDGEKLDVVAEYDGEQVFALAAVGNDLWVAVSGAESRLELRRGDEMKVAKTIALGESVRYVWDVLPTEKTLFVSTGTDGKVYAIDAGADEPKPTAILESTQKNILCLGIDGEGRIYAGTDGEGLVYRLTAKANGGYDAFVLYDAGEPEIGAILVLDDGTVYAGTADSEQARPGRLAEAQTEKTGRPEPPADDAKEPTIPNVPPKPEPTDGEKPGGDKPTEPVTPAPDVPDAPDTPKVETKPLKPTPEQYQALRENIRERLETARNTGTIKMQASPAMRRGGSGGGGSRSNRRTSGAATSKSGNAVYRISPTGFVKEVFRESVMILRITPMGQSLLVATGNEGQLYRVDPATEEVTILADLEPQQVPAMLTLGDGDVLLGTANPGRLVRLYDRYAESGTLTSEPLDATQISLWGKLQVMAALPEATVIKFQTRSGNVADPDAGSWTDWSKAHTIKLDGGASDYLDIASPNARFLQYRVTLESDGKATPKIVRIGMNYLVPNLSPKIASVKTEYAKPKGGDDGPVPLTELKVQWEAADANDDTLTYKLEAAPFGSDRPFVTIADDIAANEHAWDTRTTPDGRYVLRVTASDATDNIAAQALTTSRRSDPVLIDNTPPTLDAFDLAVADGVVTATAKASDGLSPILEVRYRVDSAEGWELALPEDLIFDSTSESVVVRIPDLAPGAHVVTLRVSDTQGNARYASKTVQIK